VLVVLVVLARADPAPRSRIRTAAITAMHERLGRDCASHRKGLPDFTGIAQRAREPSAMKTTTWRVALLLRSDRSRGYARASHRETPQRDGTAARRDRIRPSGDRYEVHHPLWWPGHASPRGD
jgi:hypothetical protein